MESTMLGAQRWVRQGLFAGCFYTLGRKRREYKYKIKENIIYVIMETCTTYGIKGRSRTHPLEGSEKDFMTKLGHWEQRVVQPG